MSPFINHQLLFATLLGFAIGQEASGDKGPAGSSPTGGARSPLLLAQLAVEAMSGIRSRQNATHVLIILAAVIAALGLYRVAVCSDRYIRNLACLNSSNQRYFQLPPPTVAWIKQHLLYAPLFRSRHSREFRLYSMNLGILPTRLQSIFLAGVFAVNISYCIHGIPWHGAQQEKLSQFRSRTGVLAIVNMIPLVLLAGRNNPLIAALNLSFDTFNIVHRFFGRMVMIEAVAHSVAHMMKVVDGGKFSSSPSILTLIPHSWMGGRCSVH